MTTPGNRRRRPKDRLEASYLRPAYDPRRRRNDVLVTGVIGFVVGAISGLAALGMIVLLAFATEVLIGFVGYIPVIVGVALVAGVLLAVVTIRSQE